MRTFLRELLFVVDVSSIFLSFTFRILLERSLIKKYARGLKTAATELISNAFSGAFLPSPQFSSRLLSCGSHGLAMAF